MEKNKNMIQRIKFAYKQENLPNARAGHRYLAQLPVDYLPSSSPTVDYRLIGLEDTGLHFSYETNQIVGIPKSSGSYEMQFNIREYSESGIEEFSTRTLKLIVEDDYNFLPEDPDANTPYRKRDEDTYAISVNQNSKTRLKKDMAAASKRGNQQIEEGKIREDDFYMQYDTDTRWYVLAVADGSGKAKYSRKGSKIACRSVVESCLERLTAQSRTLKGLTIRYTKKKSDKMRQEIVGRLHEIIASSVIDAYEGIVAEAKKFEHRPPKDYATTLLMCICKKFEFGWLIGAFGAGDGAVCVYDEDNWYANLLSGGESQLKKCFLTTPGLLQSSELERRIRFTIVDDFSALFLMTNGVSNPRFRDEDDLPSFELWNKLWNDICLEVNFSGKIKDVSEKLLKWLGFWTSGKHDDRTVAIVF